MSHLGGPCILRGISRGSDKQKTTYSGRWRDYNQVKDDPGPQQTAIMQPCGESVTLTCQHCSGAVGLQDCEAMNWAVPEWLKGGPNIYARSGHFLEFQNLPL